MHLAPAADQCQTLVLAETLDAESSQNFRVLVRQALAECPTLLAIDMHKLSYIDSTGLGLLALTRTEALRLGCEVHLVNLPQGHPRQVLELMKFDQLFKITYQGNV